MGLFAIYFKGSQVEIYFQVCSYVLQSLKIVFMIANSAGPDKLVNFVAFHLGLHCCQNNPLGASSIQRINCFHGTKV